MDIAISKNGVPIRLTSERWHHISIGHPEISSFYFDILDTIENPQLIYLGSNDGLIALSFKLNEIEKYIVVIYKELSESDGFVITAYLTSKTNFLQSKEVKWIHQKN